MSQLDENLGPFISNALWHRGNGACLSTDAARAWGSDESVTFNENSEFLHHYLHLPNIDHVISNGSMMGDRPEDVINAK